MKNKIKTNSHSELPFNKDGANVFLEIMSTISVFLFTITLAGFFMINSLVSTWDKGIVNGVTVQVMPDENNLDADELNARINKVVNFFENLKGVDKVRIVSDKQVSKLMSPWLGNNVDIQALPMPKLIDVRLTDYSASDFDAIAKELYQVAPYTSINVHQVWLNKLIAFAKSVKLLALSVLILVLSICSFSIFYATKTSLGIHRDIIEILHIMGATDDYIAKQYARRGFFIGLLSGVVGVALSFVAFWFIAGVASGLKGGILDKASLDFVSILYICSIPMWTAMISMCTSYYTVRKTLGKIM